MDVLYEQVLCIDLTAWQIPGSQEIKKKQFNYLNTFTVSVHDSCSVSHGSTRIQSDVSSASLAIAIRCLAETKPFFL